MSSTADRLLPMLQVPASSPTTQEQARVDLSVPHQVLDEGVLVGSMGVAHHRLPDRGRDPCAAQDGGARSTTDPAGVGVVA